MTDQLPLTLEARLALCRADVTLDGSPAAICGALQDFATVVTLPDGPRGQWDWHTARNIVATGGTFALGAGADTGGRESDRTGERLNRAVGGERAG